MTIPAGFFGAARRLTVADVDRVAVELGIEPRVIWAVAEIEAADRGFIADGRPEILYESHQFHKHTDGRWDASHPDISQPAWVRDYGKAGGHQYDRLAAAMALDSDAALRSTSWGLFQILGDNASEIGFTVEDLVAAMCESEGRQLDAFAAYCRAEKPLVQYLRDHDWLHFALRYNGPGQAQNNYANKLAGAYANGKYPPAWVEAGDPRPPPPPPPPLPPGPQEIKIPFGEQCSFPVSGEKENGEPTSVPPGALISSDPSICTVSVDDDIATIVAVALGRTIVRGPELEIAVSIIPVLARIKAALSKLTYRPIGAAAIARLPFLAGLGALAVAVMIPAGPPQPLLAEVIVPAPRPPAPPPSVFDNSTFCFGPGLRVIPIAECGK